MKVCACLNLLHTVLGTFGCMFRMNYIYETIQDDDLAKLTRYIGFTEQLPYVPDPGVISPAFFIGEVLDTRFPNVYIPDAPARITEDNSHKIPVRFGETLKKMEAGGDDIASLKGIPFFIAGWLRYLTGLADDGAPFEISPDPMLPDLTGYLKGIAPGETDRGKVAAAINPILSNQSVFGVDLYRNGLSDKITDYFMQMLQSPGAVRKALGEHVANL
jgi:fructuronate reductase